MKLIRSYDNDEDGFRWYQIGPLHFTGWWSRIDAWKLIPHRHRWGPLVHGITCLMWKEPPPCRCYRTCERCWKKDNPKGAVRETLPA